MSGSFVDNGYVWSVSANVEITSTGPKGARSESEVAINPSNPKNIIAVSKNFTERANYIATVTPLQSMDGGSSWTETILPLPQGWGGMTDPDIVFTPDGTAVLSAEGLAYTLKDGVQVITTLAMVVFR